jgi:small subunit ribosomal protein S9
MADESNTPQEPELSEPVAEGESAPPTPAVDVPAADTAEPEAAEPPAAEAAEPQAAEPPAAEAAEPPAAEAAEPPAAEAAEPPAAEAAEPPAAEAAEPPAAEPAPKAEKDEAPTPRERPAVPGADLEVDIVPEGVDPLAAASLDPYAEYEPDEAGSEEDLDDVVVAAPIEAVAIDLAAGARYSATGKRKSAIARVTLRPGSGSYTINGRTLKEYFPRETLQRNIRQPLETVGYEERMDVIARMHGGGVSSQAGALRHGISRALLDADPNLRGELKRRGFLTRDARAKERKKAGLKKARKRPQFSKR